MTPVQEALRLIESRPDLADFVGPRPDSLIAAAEEAVGNSFPPSYRLFLSRLGAGSFAAEEFAGLIDDNFTDSSWPNAIWFNLNSREELAQPARYFVFYNYGDGTEAALDFERRDADGECVVVLTHAGAFEEIVEDEAASFGEFFLKTLREGLEIEQERG